MPRRAESNGGASWLFTTPCLAFKRRIAAVGDRGTGRTIERRIGKQGKTLSDIQLKMFDPSRTRPALRASAGLTAKARDAGFFTAPSSSSRRTRILRPLPCSPCPALVLPG